MTDATRAEICVVAVADAFRGDGEILANPIGNVPMIGGRLARAAFEPDLVMTDGEALLVENILPVGVDAPEKVVAGWNPYRTMFDVVWSGRRHIIIAPDGRALPCPAAAQIVGLGIDNVRDRSLGEIWQHSAAFTRFRGERRKVAAALPAHRALGRRIIHLFKAAVWTFHTDFNRRRLSHGALTEDPLLFLG